MEAQADPAPVDDGINEPRSANSGWVEADACAEPGCARTRTLGEIRCMPHHVEVSKRDTRDGRRVPLSGLAALAWNAHHDAARLERHQRDAMDQQAERLRAEANRLETEADALDKATEARRIAILRSIAGVEDGEPHVHEDSDGTLYVSASKE